MSAAKKKNAPKGCACIAEVNKVLYERNAVLHTTLPLSLGAVPRTLIATEVVTPRRRQRAQPSRLVANYCPFCGKKYPEAKR